MSSPTQRTLALLRSQGKTAQVVEKWIPQVKRRIDLWGFADIAYLEPGVQGVGLVQCTAGSCHANRRTKLLAIPAVRLALETGNQIQIISWSKRGARGKRKCWTPRVETITLDHVREQTDLTSATSMTVVTAGPPAVSSSVTGR